MGKNYVTSTFRGMKYTRKPAQRIKMQVQVKLRPNPGRRTMPMATVTRVAKGDLQTANISIAEFETLSNLLASQEKMIEKMQKEIVRQQTSITTLERQMQNLISKSK